MNRRRVAALLRELADAIEAEDEMVERDIKPEKVDSVTRRVVEQNLRDRGYPLPPRSR